MSRFFMVIGIIAVLLASCEPHISEPVSSAGDVTIGAEDFTDEWWNKGAEAQEKYAGHIVQVRGVLARDSRIGTIYLQGSAGSKLCVVCSAAEDETFAGYESGEMLTLRGRCEGLDIDVHLLDCEIIE